VLHVYIDVALMFIWGMVLMVIWSMVFYVLYGCRFDGYMGHGIDVDIGVVLIVIWVWSDGYMGVVLTDLFIYYRFSCTS
jgi:hypothetical protein